MTSLRNLLAVSLFSAAFLLPGCESGKKPTTAQTDPFQGKTFPKEIKGPLGIEFVLIPAGSFYMGCDSTDASCKKHSQPKHKVTITKPFYLSKYPTTKAQLALLEPNYQYPEKESAHPVNDKSWVEIMIAVDAINNMENTLKYRLPTEAEWEYAARAGSTTKYWFGDDDAGLKDAAWYWDNASQQSHPVGQKKPNPWGLYDMYGNVNELVNDWAWDDLPEGYPAQSERIDPRGNKNIPVKATARIMRGGNWSSGEEEANSYARSAVWADVRGNKIGFRLAFTPDEHDAVASDMNGQTKKEEPNPSSQNKFYPKKIKGVLGIEFVLIPAGSFYMGCDKTDPSCGENSQPKHKVTISKSYYLSKYPITEAQFAALFPESSSSNRPTVASWPDAMFFINTLNNANDTLKYRLPTEAEWEYAARAGTTTKYWFGDDDAGLKEVAWYQGNSSLNRHPVGKKKPNPWGLYDVYGNVAEWVNDWAGKYSVESEQTDPRGNLNFPLTTANKVTRGGSWREGYDVVNSYARSEGIESDFRNGFRIAFTPDESDLVEPGVFQRWFGR